MTTPEQQAREMLERMGIQSAYQRMSAGELVELANLIAERDALKAELEAIKGAGEPVGHVYTMEPCIPGEHVRYHAQMTAKVPAGTKLYTRPCVPLTDEHVRDFVNDVGLDWQSGWTLDECEPNRYVQLVRAAEAHIKGAKP